MSQQSNNRAVGAAGEAHAAQQYLDRGYEVLATNWRPGPGAINPRGELDLVLANSDFIVFCEVKTRRSNKYGTGASAVTYAKQQSLRRLAVQWLSANKTARGASAKQRDRGIRFDVAVVDRTGSVRVYEGSF